MTSSSAFLTTAPRSLRAWARVQAEAADEAFALLTDPDAPGIPGALSGSKGRATVQPDGPATPPARRAPSPAPEAAAVAAAAVAAEGAIDDGAEELEADEDVSFEELLAEVTPGTHRESLAPKGSKPKAKGKGAAEAAPVAAATVATGQPAGGSSRVKRFGIIGAVAVAAVVVVAGVYQLGAASNSPGSIASASQQPQASAGVDQARVSDLMAKVQADPTDSASMMQLGDVFYVAGDFGAAATWFGKALAVDPTDSDAQLALGAALFNAGDMEGAEAAWIAVVEREPDNVEAHYDLGFLYLNQEPPDMDGVQREWGKVVELAPDSDVAQTVKAHLDAFESPAASTAPSASPEGSVEP